MKEINPNGRVVLIMAGSAGKKLADRIRQAKKDGLIDGFLYGSVSAAVDTL